MYECCKTHLRLRILDSHAYTAQRAARHLLYPETVIFVVLTLTAFKILPKVGSRAKEAEKGTEMNDEPPPPYSEASSA